MGDAVVADDSFEVTIVTGLSGAGRSEAADVLEDVGYFVIDNLPAPLISKVAELAGAQSAVRYAFVVDVRSGQFLDALGASLDELSRMGARTRILFLDASDDVLVRRFEATRRRHPLHAERVTDGIAQERALLEDLKARADVVIDTSDLSVHDLADRVRELFSDEASDAMQVSILSFGFKHGLPMDVDNVFDVRFLPNPHWIEDLRPLSGTDDEVREFVLGQPATSAFLEKIEALLELVMPSYLAEGRSYLSIGVGCTGGRHRSVVLAEEISRISRRLGFPATVHHRDVERE